MTAKQILDAFSETLMQDERILSPRERELLTSILQTSRTISSGNAETQSAVAAAIAQSIGEAVAQRAFALLGSSIVEQILASSGLSASAESTRPSTVRATVPQPPGTSVPQPPGKSVPQPPGSVPQPPGTSVPQPPGTSVPQPPGTSVPQPPGRSARFQPLNVTVPEGVKESYLESSVGVLDAPAKVRQQSVVLDEFLTPHELDELVAYALQHEAEFRSSEVISPSGDPGVIDFSHRRSRVLMELGKHQEVILERIRCVLPRVLDQLALEEFPITNVEAQITASNDGDFFGAHSDDAQEMIASRRVTFVYFFHREPRPFEGGELRLYDSANDHRSGYQTIVPQQNQIVFVPCSVSHEITPVECPSRAFADSRFTLNGWLHK